MITILFLGFGIYGVAQLAAAINQLASGDKIFQDTQRLKQLALIIGIPLGIAFLLLMFFKSKIKFK